MLVETETEPKTMSESVITKTVSSAPAPKAVKKKSRRNLWIALGIGALVVLGTIIYFANKKEKPTFVTVESTTVRTITQIVSATGKINPEVEVKLAPEVSGEIIQLPVKEGQVVKKGDLLFKINPQVYQALMEQSVASLSATKSQSLQSKAQLLQKQLDLKRTEELYKQKLVSETDFLSAKTGYDVSKATYEASVFDIQRQESSLKQTREQLGRTTVFAPMDGTISLLTSKLGERVVGTSQMAGTEVLRVADLSKMEVQIDVNENDIVNVKLGDTARVTVDAYPGRKFNGVVREVANTGTTTGSGTQEAVTNFKVKIRVLDHLGLLRPGMSANADIETFTVRNVLAVPIQSVTVRSKEDGMNSEELARAREMKQQSQGDGAQVVNQKDQKLQEKSDREKLQKVVFVKDGEKVKLQVVETGLADNTYIEIKSGLKSGDEVVSGSYRAITRELKEGTKVMLEQKQSDKKN